MVPIATKFLRMKATLQNREEFKEFLIQSLFDEEIFRVLMLDEKKAYQLFFDQEFVKTVESSELVFCSSRTVSWMARVLTGKEIPVIMPVTLLLDILRVSEEMNYTLYLFGGKKEINVEAVRRIRKSFPSVRLVGNYHQNIKGQELDDVLVAMRKSAPQIFFANLGGGKKQEMWMTEHKELFPKSILIGIDDSLKIIAGKQKLAPIWFQERNLTGLHQTLRNPVNFPRYFRLLVLFFITAYHRIFKKEGKK